MQVRRQRVTRLLGRAAPQGIKGSERALWADVSVLEPSDCHARRERRVDGETIERSEINGRDTTATLHYLLLVGPRPGALLRWI